MTEGYINTIHKGYGIIANGNCIDIYFGDGVKLFHTDKRPIEKTSTEQGLKKFMDWIYYQLHYGIWTDNEHWEELYDRVWGSADGTINNGKEG